MALIPCSECGEKISSKTKSCIHCGCPIEADEAELAPPAPKPKAPQQRPAQAEKKHGIPALMSMIAPGTGQLVNGDTMKGAMLLAQPLSRRALYHLVLKPRNAALHLARVESLQ